MKVLKFGGTSVGSAERMKAVAELINNDETKIVVLSAMSGTTNSLAEINNAFDKNKPEKAEEILHSLEEKYFAVVKELLSKKEFQLKGKEILNNHFGIIKSLIKNELPRSEERRVGKECSVRW